VSANTRAETRPLRSFANILGIEASFIAFSVFAFRAGLIATPCEYLRIGAATLWTALIGDYEKAPQHRLCKNDQRLKNIRSSVRDTEQAVALHYALMNDPLRRVRQR
jgi:hypothetical protein